MNKLLKFKYLSITIALFFNMPVNAVRSGNGTIIRSPRLSKTTQAKIASAQFLKIACLGLAFGHLGNAYLAGLDSLNDNKIHFGSLLKKLAQGFLVPLCGAYSSFYSFSLLSSYIKKLREPKELSNDLSDIPMQFNQENDEDIDKVLIDIVLHCSIVLSAGILSYEEGILNYTHAFSIAMRRLFPDRYPALKSTDIKPALSPRDKCGLARAPILIGIQLAAACNSLNIICSKMKNILRMYKRELPKCSLGNSNTFPKKIVNY